MSRSTTALTASLASLALLAACSGTASTTDDASTDDVSAGAAASGTTAATKGEVVDLVPIEAGVALEASTYAVPFVGDEGTEDDPRAIVRVPEGYFSAGGWVIDDGDGDTAPDEYGDVMFVDHVRRVATAPCGRGRQVDPGASARALATAMAAATGSAGTRARPATLGGAHGWYLKVATPADVSDCPGAEYHLWAGPVDWAAGGFDGGCVLHVWVLDVHGRRILAVARVVPGATHDPKQLVGIVRSARFVDRLGS